MKDLAPLAILNGRIVLPEGEPARGGLRCEGDRIVAVGPDVAAQEGDRVVDARGALIAPGLVDLGVFAIDKPAFHFGGITRAALMPDQGTVLDKPAAVRFAAQSGKPDLISGLTPEVESMLQANIEHNYGRFIGLVATSRGKTAEQVDAVAQGRVWDGGTARQNGLVDQFGGLNDALAWVANSAKLGDNWHPRFYGGEADPYASLVERLGGGDEEETDAPAAAGDLAALIGRQQDARLPAAAEPRSG